MNEETKEDRVMWLVGSEENKPYQMTTWLRCMKCQEFVEKVEEKHKIVGVVFSDNNLGFILEEKE